MQCTQHVKISNKDFLENLKTENQPKTQLSLSQPLQPDTAKKRNCCGNAAVTRAGLVTSLVTFLAGKNPENKQIQFFAINI
jgi:hypothetical protein